MNRVADPRQTLVLLMLGDGEIGVIDAYTLAKEHQALAYFWADNTLHDRAIDCRHVTTLENAVQTRKRYSLRDKQRAEDHIESHKRQAAELKASINFLDNHVPVEHKVPDKYQRILDFKGNLSHFARRGISDGDVVIQGDYIGWLYDGRVVRERLTRKISWDNDNDTSGGTVITEDVRWVRNEEQAKEVRAELRARIKKCVDGIRAEQTRVKLATRELEHMRQYENGEKPKILQVMEAIVESNRKREQEYIESIRKERELA